MRKTPFVYLSLAVLAALPAAAAAGITVTATVEAPAGDVAAGSTVQVTCFAEGSPSMGSRTNVVQVDVAVSGGTVSPSTLTGAVTQQCSTSTSTCSVIQRSVAWTTPPDPGTFAATCTATYQALFGGPRTLASAPASLTTVAAAALPPAIAGVQGPDQLAAGATGSFTVSASDPNSPALPLSYAWSAAAGALAVDAAHPTAASWTAPEAPGAYELAVAVSNGAATSTARKQVTVVLATHQAGLQLPLTAPRRLCTDDSGKLYVVDARQGSVGSVLLATSRGEARGFVSTPEPALAVAYGAGMLWVTTANGSLYRFDAATGRPKGKVALADGPFQRPLGIAYDPTSMTLWVADAAANGVRVIRPDGTTFARIARAGAFELVEPVDVAVNHSSGLAYVLVVQASAVGGAFVHAFDLSARYVASAVTRGSALGQLTRPGGVTASGRNLYVSDAFQGSVQAFGPGMAPQGRIAAPVNGPGELMNPSGLAVMKNGDLAVANTSLGRIERFGTGAALPACRIGGAVDSDCDGLPDEWELAHGLDPAWAGDSLLDLDGDALNNVEEYAYGTDPQNRDTDRDGYSDGDEALAGFDPLDPDDHRPKIAASGPAEMPPGLVKLSAQLSGPRACRASWTIASAASEISLSAADAIAPTFVARRPGLYEFDAVAVCGAARSEPARVKVAIRNVPPMVDAGRVVVTDPSSAIRLDALFSADANGDALSYAWDQTLGPPVGGTQSGAVLAERPRGAGLYAFTLTATDGAGAAASAEVPVLVTAAPVSTAIAAAFPAEAEVGAEVSLDATASLVTADTVRFAWQQVAGPTSVSLVGADRPVASFVPQVAGQYAFAVTVGEGRLRAPPARVEVYVAAAGRGLPAIAAAAASANVVDVGSPVTLEARGTGAGFAWKQVSGPAAGLTYEDEASASAVPFSPGFHVFQVQATDGAAVSRPVQVAFEARAAGKSIPVARASAVGTGFAEGQLVFLDGRASTGAARFRWTQVAGPWVALSAQAAVTTFHARAPGLYAFELEVDDGTVRSAPARVEVNVVAAAGGAL